MSWVLVVFSSLFLMDVFSDHVESWDVNEDRVLLTLKDGRKEVAVRIVPSSLGYVNVSVSSEGDSKERRVTSFNDIYGVRDMIEEVMG